MSTSSLTIVAITTAVSGKEKALRAVQERLVAETVKEPGCLRYELNQSLDDGRVLIFTEKWASEREWRAHMEGGAMRRFHASGASRLIEDFPCSAWQPLQMALKLSSARRLNIGPKKLMRNTMVEKLVDVTVPQAVSEALPELKNPDALEWAKTIPALGRNSPEYAILHVDPHTNLTTLMFRTPVAVHIKAHTHDLAETHVVLIGGTHVFKSNGVLYNVEHGGFFRMPGGVVHEAWLPAGSQTLNILESGWAVNWLHGGPSEEDMDQYPPTTARRSAYPSSEYLPR